MKRFLPVILFVLLFLLALTTCQLKSGEEPESSSSPDPTATHAETEEVVETSEPSATPYDGPVNPLTGLPADEDLSGQRPYAIMINNIQKALPQQGVSQADIIYEALVEGGITRMMAVYQDVTDVGVIGSIRSSRHYFLDLAQGLDAIYIHAGGSNLAYDAIYSRDIANIDGVHGGRQDIFYRDSGRRSAMGYEHSLMTSGELISTYVPTYNVRTEHDENFEYNMTFSDDGTPNSGANASSVTVHFSSGKSTTFTYNEEDCLYDVSQYGSSYMDGNDDSQVAVTNVLVLSAKVYRISGDTAGRLETILTGSGSGYFICGGKYVEITWTKDSYDSPFTYTLADGSELVFGRGRSYICIMPKSNELNIS